jgi:hypothetical protein
VWTQGGLRGIGLRAGIVCGLVAAASAVVLGLRFDNAGDFFDDVMPLVMPSPGLGPFAAVLAVLFSLFSLGVGAAQRDSATPRSPTPS